MKNSWKGMVIGALTGAGIGLVLDLVASASGKAEEAAETFHRVAPEAGRRASQAATRVSQSATRLSDTAAGAAARAAGRLREAEVGAKARSLASQLAESDAVDRVRQVIR
jgi:hypothetical protein